MEKLGKQEKKRVPMDIKVFIAVSIIIAAIIIAAIVYIVKPKNVATVGNKIITSEEFSYYYTQDVQNAMMQFNAQNQDINSFLSTSLGDSTLRDLIKQQTLSQLVQLKVLLQEARKEGFKADKVKLDEAWGHMEENIIQGAGSYNKKEDEFCKEVFGVSFNKVKQINNDLYTAQLYMAEKVNATAVDETELVPFYEENKVNYDYNVVSHILVLCEEDAEEDVLKAKEKAAQDILEKVNAGEDFSDLAKEFSEDTGSKDSGGIIQVQQNGRMVPEFEEWAFSNEVGDTGIVRTDFGFHIMKMNVIYDSLEVQKENITYAFQSQKYQLLLDEKLNNGEYKVEIKEGFNKF